MNKQGEGFILDIVLGIVGAVVGGFIFSAVGASGVTGFNLYSLVVAVIGAIVVLVSITRSLAGGHIDRGVGPWVCLTMSWALRFRKGASPTH